MLYSTDQESIIAQCTPRGPGAIALLRICGENALNVAALMSSLANKKRIDTVTSHTISYGHIIDSHNDIIDQVLFLVMHGPATFTGQNTVEITCHNNQLIIEQIIDRAIECGARLAQPGEFTQRAVLNKKIDILQAEGIHDLIQATTHGARKAALAQIEGSLSQWILEIEHQLLKIIALCEGSFEFIDEEVTFDSEIRNKISLLLTHINNLKQAHNKQRYIREGIRVALIGTVNAGKSSLLNRLVNRNRAIVTHHAGTTRDTLEVYATYGDYALTLVDTAGIRKTENEIEQEGISRSYTEANQADILLVIVDGSHPLNAEENALYQNILTTYQHKCILIHNKCDCDPFHHTLYHDKSFELSCVTGHGLEALQQYLTTRAKTIMAESAPSFLINARHYSILLRCERQLKSLRKNTSNRIDYELLTQELKSVLSLLVELNGSSITQKYLDCIFSSFCIGK
ncbi:tRNA uridine-5-carboxymethylaminomethyl(34) synthesis GTPase MnmE [Candidatus Babeliales bacterium]|nr:tRNA uridine-5-carboxymethylaminomethyl(34) synthesis GTPase MnmE [Candidatus Babeliales bacterium]